MAIRRTPSRWHRALLRAPPSPPSSPLFLLLHSFTPPLSGLLRTSPSTSMMGASTPLGPHSFRLPTKSPRRGTMYVPGLPLPASPSTSTRQSLCSFTPPSSLPVSSEPLPLLSSSPRVPSQPTAFLSLPPSA